MRFDDVVGAGLCGLEMTIYDTHAVADVEDSEAQGRGEEGGGAGHEVVLPGHHDAVVGGVEDAIGLEG